MKDSININNSTKAIAQSKEDFEERKNKSKPSLEDLTTGTIINKESTNIDGLESLIDPESIDNDENIVDITELNYKEEKEQLNLDNVTDISESSSAKDDINITQETSKDNVSVTTEEEKSDNIKDDEDIINKVTPNHIDNLIKEIEVMDQDPITTDTILDDITKLAKEQLGAPKMNKIDLNSFVIANEPVNLLQVMENSHNNVNSADWVLMNTGKRISMKEFSGIEIEMLNPANSRRNRYNTMMDVFANVHNHILNNPISTEVKTFLKSIDYTDIDSLYYAIYRASFNESNKITYICPNKKCAHVFLEDRDMDDMYKFDNEEAEERFWNIYERGEEELISSRVIREQISNDFVADIAPASTYSIMIESALLDDDFIVKYSQIIGILSFIRQIYKIDYNTNTLVPIHLKEYKGDESKTLRYKILNYAQILRTLNSYEYTKLMKLIEKIGTDSNGITYIIPETKCEKCGTIIPEEIVSGEDLIFTRHRLDILANS